MSSDTGSESENEQTKELEKKVTSSSESSYDEVEQDKEAEEKEEFKEQKRPSLLGLVKSVRAKMTTPPQQPRRKRFIPKYEVEGVYKVVLGEETQIQVEIVIGTHVSSQYPWKFVSKAKIMETIEIGGELSEFFFIKDQIEEYPEEELLLGYIADESKDVDEFYVCCTLEARDHCKQQSDRFIRRQEKKLEKAVQKKPRPWKSLGSEKEILELLPVNTRPLMEMEVKAKYPRATHPFSFKVRDTNSCRDGYIELTPYRQKFYNVFRCRVDCSVQVAPALASRPAQTELRYPQNMWTQSIADALGKVEDTEAGGDTGQGGGGDGDGEFGDEKAEGKSSDEDEDEVVKEPPDEVGLRAYKAALQRMRRPSYIKMINGFMSSISNEVNSIVELNTVMDIYCNDYPNLVAVKTTDTYDSMTFEEYVCFTDVRAKDKYVSSAVFHPMWSGIVAISYADGSPTVMKTLSTRPDPIQRAVYGLNPVMIWSHIDSLIPKLYLESPREVKVLSFCPFNENILVAGCINGQIVVWDLTNKLENVEKIEVLSEKREKYRIAMNAHMEWMKSVQDNAVVQATVLSNLITSHYGAVTAIEWLSPNFAISPTGKLTMAPNKKKSTMLFTGSEDGTILVWNLSVENITLFEGKKVKKSKRVLKRPSGLLVDISPLKILDRILQPCYKILLAVAGQPQILNLQTFGMDYPPVKYNYVPKNTGTGRKYFTCEIIPQTEDDMNHNIYCGSQHGEMRKVEYEGHEFNTGELVNSEYVNIKYSCYIHDGIISCTKRNPFINQLTLTVGGKIFAIWSEKLDNRPLVWKQRPYCLTDAAWSLYKPSVIFIATSEGSLETWDLLLRSDKPISVQTLSGTMLTGVSLHTLPLEKNLIGVSDANGSFKMFLDPPIFMLENPMYCARMESMINRELKVMLTFIKWQDEWMKNNPQILIEMKRKEGLLLAEKEEQKRRDREEEEQRLEEEAEKRRLERMKVIGPEEKWQMIIQKLIERTIAVKKRINRAELIEHEKPLRELEAQRLEKERRMLDIMKNQKTIFNDTVAILFPEAIKKKAKVKKSLLSDNKEVLKNEYMEDYAYLKKTAHGTVKENPYKVPFSWDATLAEGKDRRNALTAYVDFINMHRMRIEETSRETSAVKVASKKKLKLDSKSEPLVEMGSLSTIS
ncbi:dynein axonemal intermediate chain 3 [Amyelois transitella]|uniref:dynein axonemal intermediate chain 3 n=1 Tax=Amyelois transitella TaxID=680683 RepID=UPI002990051D|nr:dynein axonemal intermediate chain 3 [Amyelois transitella]